MKSTLNFGEEIRDYLHPTLKDLKVSVSMPDPLAQAQIADKMTKVENTEEAILAAENALADILRGVQGVTPKAGHEPTSKEWAHELFAAKYEFRRMDPVPVVIEGEVVKDPVSGLQLKDGEYRTWQDPRTARMYVVLWDAAKDEPVKRMRRVAFGNHIIESVLFNADEDAGKDSPTLSAG